jgi:hypothetical protein
MALKAKRKVKGQRSQRGSELADERRVEKLRRRGAAHLKRSAKRMRAAAARSGVGGVS